ncbi:MAG: DNA replication and repair protein RecF [Sphingobacteriia bacterium]|nr:MAG: DNA replication and repair protein RecF [Sphingobacteriia bacterium]
MLCLRQLSLFQFRNHAVANWDIQEKLVAITGANGAGKTNVLDAIYYLCFTRSYFARTDAQTVMHGAQGMRIAGRFTTTKGEVPVQCVVRETGKKEMQVGGEPLPRFSAHMGQFPAVMVAPDDVELVMGSSEGRRKWIDTILSQTNPEYLQALSQHNKILQQRNAFLKQAGQGGTVDQGLLDVLDHQLLGPAQFIHDARKDFSAEFIPVVLAQYSQLSQGMDQLSMQYESQLLSADYASLLAQNRSKDLLLQRSTKGIHRDDWAFGLDGFAFKVEASQGQRKSLLFAMKLAEWQYLASSLRVQPLLLLDDVFEKLDGGRMQALLKRVASPPFGQVFVSDTHPERLAENLQATGCAYQLIVL